MEESRFKNIKLYLYLFLYNDYDRLCEYDEDILEEHNIEKYAVDPRYDLKNDFLKCMTEDLHIIYDYIENGDDIISMKLFEEIRDTLKICNDEKNMYITFNLSNESIDQKIKKLDIELTDGVFSSFNQFDFDGKSYISIWSDN